MAKIHIIKIQFTLVLLHLIPVLANAQGGSEYEQQFYNLYVDDRISDWKPLLDQMKSDYLSEGQPGLLYELCFAQYGYTGYCISKEMDKEAKDCLEEALDNAEELDRIYGGRHDIVALQGAFIGYQIMLSKFSALCLGPKAYKLIKEASESSDKYFNCSMEFGNIRYFTPKFLGGSKEEAIGYYENAVALLDKSPGEENKSWIYINCLLLLANAYNDTGSKDKACDMYMRILTYEPRINRVRDEMQKKCNY